jgi:hypothetical protein
MTFSVLSPHNFADVAGNLMLMTLPPLRLALVLPNISKTSNILIPREYILR